MASRIAATIGLVTALAMLGACAPDPSELPGAPRPASVPTYTCSPPGETPHPCTPEEYTIQEQTRQTNAEANQTYRRMIAELAALQRAGGATKPSAGLAAHAGGPYLAAQADSLARLAALHAKVTGDIRVTKLEVVPGAEAKGYAVAMLACVDATKSRVVADDTELVRGRLIAETAYFKRVGDRLKVWDAEKADKASC